MRLLLHTITSSMDEETFSSPSSTVSPITIIPRPAQARERVRHRQKKDLLSQTYASMITFLPAKNPILFQHRGRRLSQLGVDFPTDSEQDPDVLGPDPHGDILKSSPLIDDANHQRRLRLSEGRVDLTLQRRTGPKYRAKEENSSSDDFITDDESSSSTDGVGIPLGTKMYCPLKSTASTRSTLSTPLKAKAKLNNSRSAIRSSPSSTAPSSVLSRGRSVYVPPTTISGPRSTSTWSIAETHTGARKGSISTRSEDRTNTTPSEFAGTQGWQCDGHPGW